MSTMQKSAFMCLGVDTTKDTNKIVVECQILLADNAQGARDLFLLKNHHELDGIKDNMEILISPFCGS